jgi:hypothetical protein
MASRLNALQHGLRAQEVVLPGEPIEEYEALLLELQGELRPEGLLETILVSKIASRIWRLARVVRLETGTLLWLLNSAEERSRTPNDQRRLIELLSALRSDSAPASDGAGPQKQTEPGAAQLQHHVRLGRALVKDAAESDVLSKLSRYETRLDRALVRDLQEFQRIREARSSEQ